MYFLVIAVKQALAMTFYRWGMLFTFPTMFGDPVSTKELRTVSSLLSEFTKRNVKCIALSCDTVEWIGDNQKYHDNPSFGYPIICDSSDDYIIKLGVQDPAEIDRVGYKVSGRAVSKFFTFLLYFGW